MLSHPEVDGGLLFCMYRGHCFLHQRYVCIHLFGLGGLHSFNIHPPFYERHLLLQFSCHCIYEDLFAKRFPSL